MKNIKKGLSILLVLAMIFATAPMLVSAEDPFIQVADIVGVPDTATVGGPLPLTGTVLPSDATNQSITWSIKDAGSTGAVIDSGALTAAAAGTVVITAMIANGISADDFDSITAGHHHTIALKQDGSLWAWGLNEYGQIGDGTYTDRNTPVRIGMEND